MSSVVEAVERSTFGQNPPNDRMFLLNGTLFAEVCRRRNRRVLSTFSPSGPSDPTRGSAKLTSSICEDDRKEFLESFLSELFVKSSEDLVDRPGCAAIQQGGGAGKWADVQYKVSSVL